MAFAWGRQATGIMAWLAFAGAANVATAADSLPPLSVDPGLLGGAAVPLPARPKPAAPANQTTPQQAPDAGVTAAGASVPQPSSRKEPSPVKSAESPAVAAVPATAATVPPAVPAATPAAVVRPVAALPVDQEMPPPKGTLGTLPSLRVDPALLGGARAGQPSGPMPGALVASVTQPPVVAEAPRLPPLYSVHAAAGAVRQRSTTPFATPDKDAAPTYIAAGRIEGVNEVELVAEGAVVLERAGDSLHADRIVYRQAEDEFEAVGNVRLASPDSLITGPRLRMRTQESTGEFESPSYLIRHQPSPVQEPALTMAGLPAITESGQVLATTGRLLQRPAVTGSGSASRIEFRGENQYRLEQATYSTCAPGKRDWEVALGELSLDYDAEIGKAREATVRFKDTPIMYVPWMSFSLGNQRKSGFLTPTFGSTSKSGLDIAVPWYWNIAPNMDATITPRLMTKRGLQLNTEFRYLDYTHNGQARIEYLPEDKLASRDRYGFSVIHHQNFGHGLIGMLNLNGVSDDDYFSDLSTRVAQVSQGNLLRQGTLSYGGPWYGATLNVQSYQTLLGLAKPYQRLPQLTGVANRYDLPFGLALNLNAEYVDFDHPTSVIAKRTTLYPQLSLPLETAAFWIRPKLGYHFTRYQMDRQAAGTPGQQSRGVPIFSADGGLVLEREIDMFGQSLIQTLEPRAYYLYVPDRDQADIPIFDTGIAGFNYAQMFAENRYVGGDRIGDANQLTLALTSRLLEPSTGEEYLRATVGYLQYFKTQQVTLPGETARTSRSADLLAALTGRVAKHIYADTAWQYNPRDSRTEKLTIGGRYRPAPGKLLNAGYRYVRDQLGQIDISGQWPLSGGWHGVGRYNYSTKERRVIETIAGLEYDAGCWTGRVVMQRLATIADKPTTALFFQLELNDFSRIGSNPLDLLRRSVPGYGVINQPTASPVFADQ